GIEVPEAMGGAGATFFMSVLVVEELARVDASLAVLVDVQNTLVNNALLRWGTDDQKGRYLPKLASKWVGAYALSEAGSGSDAFALACRAVDKGDHYELTGRKLWITNAAEADLFIVMATIDPGKGYKGISSFLVVHDQEAVSHALSDPRREPVPSEPDPARRATRPRRSPAIRAAIGSAKGDAQ
ncbi:MAG: hypothetical protein DMF82_25050, partial [Acidobacteria bacterium]